MEKMLKFSFPFSYFSLPQTNVMKLIHNAYYHKTQIEFEFKWHHFYCSRAMYLFKRKNCWIFRFRSLIVICFDQMLRNLSTIFITTKHRSSLNFGGVTFTVLKLCPFSNLKIAEIIWKAFCTFAYVLFDDLKHLLSGQLFDQGLVKNTMIFCCRKGTFIFIRSSSLNECLYW